MKISLSNLLSLLGLTRPASAPKGPQIPQSTEPAPPQPRIADQRDLEKLIAGRRSEEAEFRAIDGLINDPMGDHRRAFLEWSGFIGLHDHDPVTSWRNDPILPRPCSGFNDCNIASPRFEQGFGMLKLAAEEDWFAVSELFKYFMAADPDRIVPRILEIAKSTWLAARYLGWGAAFYDHGSVKTKREPEYRVVRLVLSSQAALETLKFPIEGFWPFLNRLADLHEKIQPQTMADWVDKDDLQPDTPDFNEFIITWVDELPSGDDFRLVQMVQNPETIRERMKRRRGMIDALMAIVKPFMGKKEWSIADLKSIREQMDRFLFDLEKLDPVLFSNDPLYDAVFEVQGFVSTFVLASEVGNPEAQRFLDTLLRPGGPVADISPGGISRLAQKLRNLCQIRLTPYPRGYFSDLS